jgi:hypothetical protein
MRFERAPQTVMGSKLFGRHEVSPTLERRAALDKGDFLARLWAHFGAPEPADGGFHYSLRDRESGHELTAYSGPSGPSYGGDHRKREQLRPVIEALEALLTATQPVECELRYTADIDYGGGEHLFGWKDGRSFERSIDKRTPPKKAKTYEDCVAIAKEYESGYGAEAGWQQCIDQILPEAPESVDWNGDHYAEPLGFTIEDGRPFLLYIGASGSPENVPLEAIPWKLPPVARLWLDSLARRKKK